MNIGDRHRQSRRDFLTGMLRTLGLAGLAVFAGTILTRRPATGPRETCINKNLCRPCTAFDRCELPAALSARQAMDKR